MNLNLIDVNSSKVAVRCPQVYIICIMKPKALVYVGQTCQCNGVLARFFQHMSGGTLTEILNENGIYKFKDISVIAVDLSEYTIFNDVYNRKREALEYLIHREMKVLGCKTAVPFKVISRVSYNSEVTNENIQTLAKEIARNVVVRSPFWDKRNMYKTQK